MSCGYDHQGNDWKEPELTSMRKRGLIVKEYPYKTILFENILLGYVHECLDDTWSAHSPYNALSVGDMEISGFINEFYAVRYLHQVIKANYPEEIGDLPCLPWEHLQTNDV
ncbi:MAG: hypothetical protein HC785_29260 [Calothrix sp. CSU_2_0]|nr:hypothetical protein [Calothrix sp. CSU_2_0]